MARIVGQCTSCHQRWYADIVGVALGTVLVKVSTPSALKNAQAV